MAILDKIKNAKKISPTNNPPLFSKNNLDKRELTIILNLIKGTTFKGDNIEVMYNLILKLQDQYSNLK